MYYKAPTYNIDTDTWTTTDFELRRDVVTYIDAQVKYPGRYNLKYTEGYWNQQGNIFQKTGAYPIYMDKSLDFKKHWDAEKNKCAFEGFVIYKKPSEKLEYAVPGLFYWYLNYCPIVDKLKKKIVLPEIYDGDYHYYLYILRCILHRKYGAVIKKRQAGYTLKNMSIFGNVLWFGEAATSKIFAPDESKVKDAWGFLENYRDHVNKYCGWKRGFDPSKKLDWQVRRKRKDGSYTGNMSIGKGFTTKQDPTNGVGGSAQFIYGEEAGMNSTLDITHEYITSNVALGGLVTGLIIYSGAVGELEKSEPLKSFILRPEDNDFLSCPNEIEDDFEYGTVVGFFAPEWWNYISNEEEFGEIVKCYDEWGNTDKEKALSEIHRHRIKAKLKKPEAYRYYCSQRPLSIREAFAMRKDSKFSLQHLEAQKRRIETDTYPFEYVDLDRDERGDIIIKRSNKSPIKDFPINPSMPNKEGVIVIVERPVENPVFGMYFGSIDPVSEGHTSTSESLCSIYIYKNDVEVIKEENGESKVFIEQGGIVAYWCGRYDDLNKTHEQLSKLIELYNAWTIYENNIKLFGLYMTAKRRMKYLVPKDQISFLKEHQSNEAVHQEHGWRNTGVLFKKHLVNYAAEFLTEEIDHVLREDGEVMKTIYGVERIPDIMLIREMGEYRDGLNVDRLVAFAALVAFVRGQQAIRGFSKRIDRVDNKVDKNLYKKDQSLFRHIGGSQDQTNRPQRSPFKNLR